MIRHIPSRQRSFLMTRPACLDMADPGELYRLHTAGPAAAWGTLSGKSLQGPIPAGR